jgi:hypothetical protein
MRKVITVWVPILVLLASVAPAWAQEKATAAPTAKIAAKPAAKPPATDAEKNMRAYIELLRTNVRQQKSQMMGAVMELSAADAAKFWPIYSEYDAALAKVNDLRVANIQEYSRTYTQLTDEKADELIQKSMEFQKQRAELLAQYYGRMKDALGATTAARFVQVEYQLLLIIDLQIASALPLAQEGS